MPQVESIEVETGPRPAGSVIWLHGLGADGHDFEAIVPELRLPPELSLRFVFPHAPLRPVTINGGMHMRAWYDIVSLDQEGRADATGIAESNAILNALVDAEVARGVDPSKIVIAGFSQGGAIALHNVLHRSDTVAGVMALSTYLALPESVDAEATRARDSNPVPAFVAHGSFDPMVPLHGGQHSADKLRALGYDVEWHEYPMAHGVCPQEIDDIRHWLVSIYSPRASI